MVGSTSRSYPWTRTKIDAALSASLVVTRGGKEDCFLVDKIARAVSKLNSKNEFNCDLSDRVLTQKTLEPYCTSDVIAIAGFV